MVRTTLAGRRRGGSELRLPYATELLLQGLDPTHARKLTGHKNELAFKRYTLRSEQEAAIAAYYRVIGEEQDEEEAQI